MGREKNGVSVSSSSLLFHRVCHVCYGFHYRYHISIANCMHGEDVNCIAGLSLAMLQLL